MGEQKNGIVKKSKRVREMVKGQATKEGCLASKKFLEEETLKKTRHVTGQFEVICIA